MLHSSMTGIFETQYSALSPAGALYFDNLPDVRFARANGRRKSQHRNILAGGAECVVLRHNVRLRRTSVGRIWLFQLGQASEEARCSQIANAYIE